MSFCTLDCTLHATLVTAEQGTLVLWMAVTNVATTCAYTAGVDMKYSCGWDKFPGHIGPKSTTRSPIAGSSARHSSSLRKMPFGSCSALR